MADYTTTYVFRLDIEGKEAVQKAQAFRQQLDQALSGAMGTTKAGGDASASLNALAKAADQATKALRSLGTVKEQTSRRARTARQATLDEAQATDKATEAIERQTAALRQLLATYHELMGLGRNLAATPALSGWSGAGRAQLPAGQMADPMLFLPPQQRNLMVIVSRPQDLVALRGQNLPMLMGGSGGGTPLLPSGGGIAGYLPAGGGWGGGGGGGFPSTGAQMPSPFDSAMNAMIDESRRIWPIRSLGYGMQNIGRTMLIQGAAQAAAMASLTNEYLQFDYAATRVGQAMELQTELQPMLRDAILETTEAIGRFDTDQVAEGLRTWAAGIGAVVEDQRDLNQIMGETLQIQKLAALNNVEFAGTVDAVGGIMHEYGLTTRDVNHITEVLNYVAAKSFANVNDLGEAFKMVGPQANELGISFDETAAALSLLSDSNIKGTMAGRAFRQMLIQMQKPSAEYNKVMNASLGLTRSTGEAWREIVMPKGQFIGLPDYIDLLAERTENLTDTERSHRLAVLSTANSLPTLTTLVRNQIEARQYGVNVMSAYTKIMNGVADAETMAYKRMVEDITGLPFALTNAHMLMTGMWDEYVKGDTYRADVLKRQWENTFIRLGEVFTELVLPPIEAFTNTITRLLDTIESSPALSQMASNMATLAIVVAGTNLVFGRLLATIGSIAIAWTNYQIAAKGIKAAQIAAGVAPAAGPTSMSGTSIATLTVLSGLMAGLNEIMPDLVRTVIARVARSEATRLALGGNTGPLERLNQFNELYQDNAALRGMIKLFGPSAGTIGGEPSGYRDYGTGVGQAIAQAIGAHNLRRIADAVDGIAAKLGLWNPTIGRAQSMEREKPAPATPLTQRERAMQAAGLGEKELAIAETFYQYTQDAERIEQDFLARRQDMVQSFNDWRVQAEEDLGRRLTQAKDDYAREGARRLEDYNKQVAKVNEDANRQEAEQERRHLDSLRKAQRDHRDRLIDLLEEGDVRGIVKEMRRYRNQREDMSSQVEQERAQRADERKRRLAEMDEQFKLENARRDEDFALQQRRAEEALELERQRRQQALNEQIADLTTEKQRALDDLDDTLVQAMAKLMGFATYVETKIYPLMYNAAVKAMAPFQTIAAYLEQMAEMESRIESIPYGPARDYARSFLSGFDLGGFVARIPVAGRASGGYVENGLYAMGERGREFVLNADTTRLLEARYGRLDQDTFAGMGESFSYAPYIDLRGASGVDLPAIRRAWRQDMDAAFESYATRRRTPVYGR